MSDTRLSDHSDPHMRLYTTMLRVRDLERAQSWYESVLGFRLAYRDLGYPLAVLARECGCTVALWELNPEEPLVPSGRQGCYLVFAAPDAVRSHRELTARGAVPEPMMIANGLHLFWFSDPDGHRHCVLQFLPE